MFPHLSRRDLLHSAAAAGVGLAATTAPAAAAVEPAKKDLFGYCLNTSTISGQKLDIIEQVEIAAKAGYDSIEPWIRDIDQYVKGGGDLKGLGKRIQDRGLQVPSAIAFSEWIVDDDDKRKKGFEDVRRCMDLVLEIGGKRIAAPPAGVNNQTMGLEVRHIAERYRELLEIGDKIGVVPMLEVWGHAKVLNRLSQVAYVALESGHRKACVLADVYHLYKGGSDFKGVHLLSADALPHFHFNDYPDKPARVDITDAARVYPGDGIAPLKELLHDLRNLGYRGALSLELFNREYWKQDALQVAKTGLEKMKAVVRASADL